MARRFDRALESATDQTLVEPFWEGILECVDLIRAGDVPVKSAVASIQKRFHHENPHVAHHALLVLEACVKNCGKRFHDEISTKEFMDDLKNLVIEGAPDKVKNKILELLQCWSHAFSKYPQYKIVCDTHSFMKMYGFEFPAMKEADAMFMADSAPEWADGDSCFRCRVEFGVFTRKHHCRNCGQIFCDKCSNRQMVLPQFGIEKEVRVCEACYTKKSQEAQKNELQKLESALNNHEARAIAESEAEEKKRLQELKEKEEEELQLALAISQSEAEAKEKERQKSGFNVAREEPTPAPSIYSGVAQALEPDTDLTLAQYLDRDYWERRQASREVDATAPPASEISFSMASSSYGQHNGHAPSNNATPTNESHIADITHGLSNITVRPLADNDVEETQQFCNDLKERVETMNNRMLSNMNRGRSIVYDSAIHALFEELTQRHGDVLRRMDRLDSEREYHEGLQDKLSEIQVARQAVNALREEHERLEEERLAEEQRQRQHQMQMQLDIMRQKKASMLMQQRDEALLRFQAQQAEIQRRRMEAQFQYQQGQAYPGHPSAQQYYPPGYPQPPQYPVQQQLPGSSDPYGQPQLPAYSAALPPQHQSHQPVNGYPQSSIPSSIPTQVSSQPYGYAPPMNPEAQQHPQALPQAVPSHPHMNGYSHQPHESTPIPSAVPSSISVNSNPSFTDASAQPQHHYQQQPQVPAQAPAAPPQYAPQQPYGYQQYPPASAPPNYYGHPDPHQQQYYQQGQQQAYPGYYPPGYPPQPQHQAPAPQPQPPVDDAPLISFD
ncbi:unnamed protein product [Bursaphelenchus xylophilus]|uniref:Hepatocyte growth factor-regulated tyrosine kinase substrate n=1 Tax=Bursaphelenchus xylophilus TaxID=6326 RepID=A0A1I7S539_BURXY|nr:unnamed protein product [Bursaphelenchus xylophilus]CAG9117673.1 unnamed protein product [Bursaphelenchus xylophilus]